ncbi:toxin Cry1Ac domain D-VI-related protein [Listeria seeligeri]|uniref:toxin Cry1Ac domain D-VI-related protein n=1 Tax=Listeria seeligeri TaxID=1640 RepID=UPI001A98D922|nr:toxin Cry1Ac domain D-VI-related protein [Listeria seeligeri]
MKKLSKRVTWILAICGILVAGGISWGIYSYIDNKNQITEQETQVANLEKQVNDLYSDNTKELLKKDIGKENIEKTEKALDEFKGQDLLTPSITENIAQIAIDWGNADYMYTYKMQVEKLLDPNDVLRADADIKKVEAQREELIKNTKKETFAKSFDPVVKEATAQQTQIDVATKQVDGLFTSADKMKVKEDVTRTSYETANKSVGKIKQAKAKEELSTSLNKVNKYLTDEEAKTAAAEEKAAQEAAELASAQEATEESTSSETSGNSNAGSNDSAASNGSNSGQESASGGSSAGSSNDSSSSGSSSNSGKSASKSSGSSGNSGSAKSSSGSSSKDMKPGDTYEGKKTGEGEVGDNNWSGNGNTWESGTW